MGDVDAVGDDVVVTGEVGCDEAAGGEGDGDLAVEAPEAVLEQSPGVAVEEGAAVAGGVKGPDVNGVGEAKELDRQERYERLVDVDDVVNVVLNWGCTVPPGPCPGDVNSDFIVNVDDLVLIILNWGQCIPF